jgi:signal transduction histidine kinase
MNESAARVAVIVAVTLIVVLETVAVALTLGVGALDQALIYAVYAIVQVLAGAAVVWSHPRHRVGWLLVVSSLFTTTFTDALLAYGKQAALHGWPAAAPAQVVALSGWMVAALGLVLLFLWFPDGRVRGPGRWIPWAGALGALLGLPGWALNPRLSPEFAGHVNPYAASATWTEALFLCGTALVVAALLASVVVFVLRFRSSEGVEHLQLKWMAFAAVAVAVVLPISTVLWTVWPPVQLLAAAALTLLPVATSVAILRYHLYDVDLIVSRTVAYAAITGLLAATYAAVVVLAGAALSSPMAAAVGAFVVAVAFRPVRDRVQETVDRRFRRARYETRRVMADFVDALRRGVASVDDLEDQLRAAVGEPTCAVAFDTGTEGWLDIHGQPVTDDVRRQVPTTIATSAHLAPVVVHPPGAERLVLEALDAGRLAFEIAALQADLRRQVDELDASRARVVAVADQERRRLARDLHDGAQQRLVTIGLTLRHVQHTLDGSAPEAIHDLDEAVTELAHAIDDLRELAGGLRPSSLDHGLRAALDDLASRTPSPVRLDVTTERFTPEIETAAYFIAAEGLTNAVKHARAQRIDLAVAHDAGQLVVAVDDDGMGGADLRRGTGLVGLADRARSHGGTLEITSRPGAGTSLRATLPCA